MTKKLICLLLAAFLGVSLIALFAACCSKEQTPDETAAESQTVSAAAAPSDISPGPSTDATTEAGGTTDGFSSALPREETTT